MIGEEPSISPALPETSAPVVRVEGLSFSYSKPPRAALKSVDLAVQPGQIFGLLGPNGGGKTTLFKILSTYFTYEQGRVRIFDLDLKRDPNLVRRRIGVVFQAPSLDKKLTVQENLAHQGRLYGLSGSALRERIEKFLARVKLTDRRDDLAETLSGGLQRRAEIAKSLLHLPSLLLMDEPSTGLDPGARRDLWDYLQELKRDGITVLLTTHLMEEAEKCERLAILNEGAVVALGAPDALKAEIGGDVVTVETAQPVELAQSIREKFGLEAIVMESAVRIERERGHEFVPQLAQAFPGRLRSITVGQPTLEDVFIHRTGHKFWNASGGGA